MQPASINTRLWLTYTLLIFLVLIAALGGIIFAFQRSPLLYRQIFLRIDLVSNLLCERLSFVIDANWDPTIQLFFKEAEILDVEAAILDQDGQVVFSTGVSEGFQVPSINNPQELSESSLEKVLVFRDDHKVDWFYQISEINKDYFLLAAAKRPNIEIPSIFQDELVKPLLQAGLFAIIGAFVLSWLMAKWITRPLKKISESAQNIAVGKYGTVPIEGPSEVQQLAHVINDMSRKVEDSIKSQRDFVANVSHEFKTPLTSIQGFSQAISDGTVQTDEEIKHASDVILNETGRLNVLVNDLLELAKLDAGTMAMNKVDIELNELVKNVIEHLHYEIEKSGIQLVTSYTSPIHILADGTRLAQVLSNLLDNAMKFSKPGSEVKVKVDREDKYAKVSVADFGVGISEEDTKRIFERFYQADKARSGGAGRGVGLGLAIANQIVRAHGGQILLTSQLGVGSTFMVKLPIEDAKRKEPAN